MLSPLWSVRMSTGTQINGGGGSGHTPRVFAGVCLTPYHTGLSHLLSFISYCRRSGVFSLPKKKFPSLSHARLVSCLRLISPLLLSRLISHSVLFFSNQWFVSKLFFPRPAVFSSRFHFLSPLFNFSPLSAFWSLFFFKLFVLLIVFHLYPPPPPRSCRNDWYRNLFFKSNWCRLFWRRIVPDLRGGPSAPLSLRAVCT